MRVREIQNYHKRVNDVEYIRRAYPKIQIRYNISPKKKLESAYNMLKLDKKSQ